MLTLRLFTCPGECVLMKTRVSVLWRYALITLFCGGISAALHGADEAGAVTALDETEVLELSRQISLFEDNIVALESEQGPYGINLVEMLMGLGRYYNQLGQYEAAAEAFERAFNITRIGYGLYSAQQLDALDALSMTYKSAAEWRKADDKEYLAFHLKSRLYGTGSQAYAEAVLSFAQWRMQAVRGNLLRQSGLANMRDLEELLALYNAALHVPDVTLGESPRVDTVRVVSRLEILYAKAQAEYQLTDYILASVPRGLDRPVDPYVTEYVCTDVVGANGQVSRRCGTVRRENPVYREYEMQRRLYRDRVRMSMSSMQASIQEFQALAAQHPDLSFSDGRQLPPVSEELGAMQTALERSFRRSAVRW
jgi:tetratricopeptide (TPR) repeat protein